VIAANPSAAVELVSPPTFRVLPESGWAGAGVVAGTGVACMLAQWVAVQLWVPPANVTTVWVEGGILLAAALLTEPRRWPAVITAGSSGAVFLFLGLQLVAPVSAVVLGVLAGLQTVALAGVFRLVLRGPLTLGTLREFRNYLVVVVVGGAIAASTLFIAGAWALGYRAATFQVWRTFALASLLGYLTVTPMLVLLIREADSLRRAPVGRGLEAGLLTVLLGLASGFVFLEPMDRSVTWPAFVTTIPPLLLWSAMRFGVLGASTSVLVVTLVSTLGTARGLGPFTSLSAADNILWLQAFMLSTALPLLGLAVAIGEQRRTSVALKSSELRLRKLNRDLTAAREEEATRIARELHDDVGQRLALVSIGLSRLRQAYGEGAPRPVRDVTRIQEQASSIAHALREISHQLRPPELEQVGLGSALEMKCDEVRQATGLSVGMCNHGDTSSIPPELALCLFRVAQEAFNNVIRHSGAHNIDLELRREGAELLLQVTDDGRGFEPGASDPGNGLGLYSIGERVHAVGGTVQVDSAPGGGTTIRVAVPVREVLDA